MSFWAPKTGPLFTRGRLAHLAIGALFATVGSIAGGYSGLAWSGLAVGAGAFAWELSTPYLAKLFGWSHDRGDVLDLAAFLVGWILPAVPIALLLPV